MDAVAALLDGPHARGAFLLRSVMRPPWSVRVQDEAPLAIVAVVTGSACIALDGEEPVFLGERDTAIIRGPGHYTVADDLSTPHQAVIHPGQVCTTPDGSEVKQMKDLGVRTWGNDPDGETVLLTGIYTLDGEVSRRLLRVLPSVVVVRANEWDTPLIPLLADEIEKADPGQEAVLDRLLDLLLIAALRAWFSRPESGAPAWWQAYGDPIVGPALRMLQNNPANPWTVAELAKATNVSRATLARRFTELVGEPPMMFLTEWRIAIAADLLLEPGSTVGSVAREVGYGSPFALSTAFKRVRGLTPQQHRELARREPRPHLVVAALSPR